MASGALKQEVHFPVTKLRLPGFLSLLLNQEGSEVEISIDGTRTQWRPAAGWKLVRLRVNRGLRKSHSCSGVEDSLLPSMHGGRVGSIARSPRRAQPTLPARWCSPSTYRCPWVLLPTQTEPSEKASITRSCEVSGVKRGRLCNTDLQLFPAPRRDSVPSRCYSSGPSPIRQEQVPEAPGSSPILGWQGLGCVARTSRHAWGPCYRHRRGEQRGNVGGGGTGL